MINELSHGLVATTVLTPKVHTELNRIVFCSRITEPRHSENHIMAKYEIIDAHTRIRSLVELFQ